MYPLRPLRVLFTNYYPYSNNKCSRFPMLRRSEGCRRPGILAEVIGCVSRKGGYEVLPYLVTNGERNKETLSEALGEYESQVTGLVLNGTVDTMALPIHSNGERVDTFEYSHHIYRIRSFLVINRLDNLGNNYWSLFATYDALIWKILGCVLFLQCLFGLIVRYIEKRSGFQSKVTAGNTVWKIIRIQFFQADTLLFRFRAGNFALLIFSLLQCTFVFGIFSSFFLSAMLHPTEDLSYAHIDRILEDIREGRRDLVVMSNGSWFQEKVTNGSRSPYRQFHKALAGRKMVIERDQDAALDLVRTHSAILFYQEDEHVSAHIAPHCEYLHLDVDFPKLDAHFVFATNWSGLHDFSEVIRENIEEIYNIKRRYIQADRLNAKSCSRFKIGDPMKIVSYVGVLIVCGGMLLAATLIMLFEVMVSRCRLMAFLTETQ